MRAFLIASLLATAAMPAGAETAAHTITVDGEATLYVEPDHASIDFGVQTLGATVAEALGQNNVKMARVLDALRAQGVARADIQTTQFQIEPQHPLVKNATYQQYDYSVISGYQVVNKITVTVSDMKKIGTVVDAAANAGANSSNSVAFQIDNREALLDKARAEAMRNARHKAEVMAGAVGAGVGALISVGRDLYRPEESELAPPPPPPPPPPAPGASILPGQLQVSARVTAVFELK